MKESLDQISGYLTALFKHRWPMLMTSTIICALGWTGVFLIPDKYQATSKLLMSNESMMGPLLKGLAAESNLTREMASLMRRTLLSRPNLEKVIDDTDLNLWVTNLSEREELIRDLESIIQVTGDERSKIYSISMIEEDPELVTDVVQKLTDIFIEHSVGATRKDTSITRDFLEKEIVEYEQKLRMAEERLEGFKRKNIGLMPTEGGTYFSQLQEKMELLELSQLELAEAKKRMASVQRELNNIPKIIPRQVAQVTDNSLNEEITALRSELEDLKSRYTNEYPGIVSATQRLESLLAQRRDKISAEKLGTYGTSPEAAAAIIDSRQNLNLQLANERGEVGALNVRVAGLRKQVTTMKKNVDVMPKVEAQLAQLDRDYDVIKQTYEGLVQRREATALSDQAETSASDFQFQVIESPITPTLPVSPDRSKLVLVVFMAAIGAGAMFAIMLSQVREYVTSVGSLKELVKFPVYGSVTNIVSNKERSLQRRQLTLLATFWSLLVMVLAGLLYITYKRINLLELISGNGGLL